MPAGLEGAVSVEGRLLRSYSQLVELVSEKRTDEDASARTPWAGWSPAPARSTRSCAACAPASSRSSLKSLRAIVRGDLSEVPGRRISTEGQQVTVVDLRNLSERAQRFV